MKQQIVGSFEYVSMPLLGIEKTLAKIDTGAYSGAIHCSDMRVVKRASDGKRVLQFAPLGDGKKVLELEDYHMTYVRSSTGHRVRRYVIDSEIIINGNTYPIRIGLSDRKDLKFEILIGRRFLREQNILVDTRINQELDSDGGRTE